MDTGGSNWQMLVSVDYTEGTISGLDWSPDGNQIVYSLGGTVYTMNADGNNKKVLVDNRYESQTECEWFIHPQWSPDGNWIAFDCTWGIYVISSDGTVGPFFIVDGDYPMWLQPD